MKITSVADINSTEMLCSDAAAITTQPSAIHQNLKRSPSTTPGCTHQRYDASTLRHAKPTVQSVLYVYDSTVHRQICLSSDCSSDNGTHHAFNTQTTHARLYSIIISPRWHVWLERHATIMPCCRKETARCRVLSIPDPYSIRNFGMIPFTHIGFLCHPVAKTPVRVIIFKLNYTIS